MHEGAKGKMAASNKQASHEERGRNKSERTKARRDERKKQVNE
jgi:hypothetical protein